MSSEFFGAIGNCILLHKSTACTDAQECIKCMDHCSKEQITLAI